MLKFFLTILSLNLSLFTIQPVRVRYKDGSSSLNNWGTISEIEIVSSDDLSNPTYNYNNYCKKYFDCLYSFPTNIDSSCGLVALSMLLGYFDSYYNTDLLNSIYTNYVTMNEGDFYSLTDMPGTINENVNSIIGMVYSQLMNSLPDNSIQKKLIKIGADAHIFDDDSGPVYDGNSLGTVLSDRVTILQNYLETSTYHPNLYLYGDAEDDLCNYCIDTIETEITSGYNALRRTHGLYTVRDQVAYQLKREPCSPWLISYATSGINSHCAIAYYYDEANDKLYIHNGYHDNRRLVQMANSSFVATAMKLSLFCDHQCSDAYHVLNSQYSYYCPNEDIYY